MLTFSLFSLRIYPHFQDTGGFFIAVFEKIGPIKDVSVLEDASMNEIGKKDSIAVDDVETIEASVEPDSTTIKDEIVNEDADIVEEMNQNLDNESVPIKRPPSVDQFGEESYKRTKTNELATASNPDNEEVDTNPGKKRQSGEVFIFLEQNNDDVPLIRLDQVKLHKLFENRIL